MEEDVTLYATYNGLNRPAMIKGMPIMAIVIALLVSLIGGGGAIYLFGWGGLFVPALCFLTLFAIRIICEYDPNALRVMKLAFSGWWLKLKHRDGIIGFSSVQR